MKICVFIGDMYRDFALGVLKRLDYYAQKKGYRIDVFGMCSMPTTNPLHVTGFKSILSLPDVHDYDGVILCSDTLIHEDVGKDLIEELLSDNDAPPVVCIRTEVPGLYGVIPDNRALMYKIAKHVISKCKTKNIGFVTGIDDLGDSIERRLGFEDAMKEAGHKVSEKRIFHGNYWFNEGPQMVDFFMKKNGKLPEAIICSNDYEALAICNELRKRGYHVPQDVLVSGVDNVFDVQDYIPSITTVEISRSDFVDAAVSILEDLSHGKKRDLITTVPSTLILRESTGDLVVERDAFTALCDMKAEATQARENPRQYTVISDQFEGALSKQTGKELTLSLFKEIESVRSFYLCRYQEDNRSLVGYFANNGEPVTERISFSENELLPEGVADETKGMRIHLPVTYKNETYGYSVLVVDTNKPNFLNFKIEFLMMQIGLSINRFELYERLFGISDVMTLYLKDPLTDTFNRRGFEKKLSEKFDSDGKMKKRLAVVSIDMDSLKPINDTYGHSEGDEAIKGLAKCISSALAPGEFVARMGGDEFEVVLILSEPGRVGKFIRGVRNSIKDFNQTGDHEFELSASIGTCDVTDWKGITDCMKQADKAMYLEKRAKKKGR